MQILISKSFVFLPSDIPAKEKELSTVKARRHTILSYLIKDKSVLGFYASQCLVGNSTLHISIKS